MSKTKAIESFVNRFKGSYKKLSPNDVSYRIYDKDKNLIAYVQVESSNKLLKNAYPLEISAAKATKLCAKRLNPTIVWACKDGILYSKIENIKGEVAWGGKELREELMMYFPKQKSIKYICYY